MTFGGVSGSGLNYTESNNFTINNGTILSEDDLQTFTGLTTIGAGGARIYTQWQNLVINNLTGSGPLTIDTMFINATAPAGVVHLSGSGGYTGTVTVNQAGVAGVVAGHGGEVSVDSAAALENAALVMSTSRGLLFGVASPTLGSLSGTGNIALPTGTLTLNTSTVTPNYSGVLSGSGALSMAGNGLQTLSGASTFTGNVTVNSGTLNINYNGTNTVSALGNLDLATRSVTVNSGGVLEFSSANSQGQGPILTPFYISGEVISTVGNNGNTFGPLVLTGGTLTGTGGFTGAGTTFEMFNLGSSGAGSGVTGSITANGAANSYISLTGAGNGYNGFNLR